jgi:hypothetical protein
LLCGNRTTDVAVDESTPTTRHFTYKAEAVHEGDDDDDDIRRDRLTRRLSNRRKRVRARAI